MELLDPATGQPLPNDAIQRVLLVANTVHVYNIPPQASSRGHSATAWTAEPQRHIFTARLRVVETSFEAASAGDGANKLKVDLVFEDPSTGQLFAAAPYLTKASVEPVYDSSRFFAVTVRDPQGRKALLGIGFEDRSDAFDLSVALQEARRALGLEVDQGKPTAAKKEEETKDYSLKKGETITINLGGTSFGKRRPEQQQSGSSSQAPVNLQAFALAPPPSASSSSSTSPSTGFSLPPPPGPSSRQSKSPSAQDLGFDDGKFGEFS